jgi:hypothetical protein
MVLAHGTIAIELFKMIVVNMRIAKSVNEFPWFQVANLRNHHRE